MCEQADHRLLGLVIWLNTYSRKGDSSRQAISCKSEWWRTAYLTSSRQNLLSLRDKWHNKVTMIWSESITYWEQNSDVQQPTSRLYKSVLRSGQRHHWEARPLINRHVSLFFGCTLARWWISHCSCHIVQNKQRNATCLFLMLNYSSVYTHSEPQHDYTVE